MAGKGRISLAYATANRIARARLGWRLGAVAIALFAVFAAPASAAIVTFGNSDLQPFTGGYGENGFTFSVISGTAWDISSSIGNPPSALSTGLDSVPNSGDRIDVYRPLGGLFTFDQFDFVADDGPSDTVNFIGYVAGVPTEALLAFGTTSGVWQTTSPGFAAPIDLLRILINTPDEVDLQLDNFVFTPIDVPEPGTWGLLAMGAMTMGWSFRRR